MDTLIGTWFLIGVVSFMRTSYTRVNGAKLNYHIMTLFPEMFEGVFATSILKRGIEQNIISYEAHNIRDYTEDKHMKTDDYPYGGGAGMVMQVQPIMSCYEAIKKKCEGDCRVVYLTPWGKTFDNDMAIEMAQEKELIFLCGHYEGVDERVIEEIVTDPVSIGDYVLTGGELASMVMIDAISRQIPGFLGNDSSTEDESFQNGLLEYPQYSRPYEIIGRKVPDVLLSGDHAKVDEWRFEQSIERTKKYRPDLWEEYIKTHDMEPKKKKRKR